MELARDASLSAVGGISDVLLTADELPVRCSGVVSRSSPPTPSNRASETATTAATTADAGKADRDSTETKSTKKSKGDDDKGDAVKADSEAAVASTEAPKRRSSPKADAPKREPAKKEAPRRATDGGDADLSSLLGDLGEKKKSPPKKAAAPKQPAAGKPTLSKSDIQSVVRANGKRISRCASRIPGPPNQKVKIEMSWEIQPNGRVSGASVLTGKYKDHSVGRCVLSAVKAMQFPSHGGKPIKIGKYPFGLKK